MAASLLFEWDEDKALSNAAKHRVSFAHAVRVFLDPDRVELDATRPADGESRFKVVGMVDGRLHVVVGTRRGGVHRIISARRANASEEKAYGYR